MSALTFIGQSISCPLCTSANLICIGQKDRHSAPLKTDLCRNCGHVFTNPQPTKAELNAFYSDNYRSDYKGVMTPKPKHIYRAGLRALERLDRLLPYAQPAGRVLDIGSGGGEFIYLMTRAGFQAKGIEPNRGYADFSKTSYEIDVDVGTVEATPQTGSAWDVITLHHVLEHLADPVNVLRALGQQLSESGVLIVEVPNVEARYHGPHRLFHLAHLHNFSHTGLIYAGSLAGLVATDLAILPGTGHLNVVFKKSDRSPSTPNSDRAAEIERHLRRNTRLRDIFSTRPFRRLWANLKRPIREVRALRYLGNPVSAQDILDRMYGPALLMRVNS
ncbi:MAG: class I SAM-dependent methyltransferase [Rhodospirillaceae bacterium]